MNNNKNKPKAKNPMLSAIGANMNLPPNAAQLRNSRQHRQAMLDNIPEPIVSLEDFRAAFYDALQNANFTGKQLGALFWRLDPLVLMQITNQTKPSCNDIMQLLQNPRRILPASDPQPQAEKIGLGFYRCLHFAHPELRGKVFLYTLTSNMYGIPSHPRSPMIPQAVKMASIALRVFKQQSDLIIYSLIKAKQDTALWLHLEHFIQKMILPLSMARRKQNKNRNPLIEGSFMDSVARSYGALWMKYMMAPDYDKQHAAIWGRIWRILFQATEKGGMHTVYRTPAKDDVRTIAYNGLLAATSINPIATADLLSTFGIARNENLIGSIDDITPEACRKMASVTANKFKQAILNTIQTTPDGVVPAGSTAKFLSNIHQKLIPHLVKDEKQQKAIITAFDNSLL